MDDRQKNLIKTTHARIKDTHGFYLRRKPGIAALSIIITGLLIGVAYRILSYADMEALRMSLPVGHPVPLVYILSDVAIISCYVLFSRFMAQRKALSFKQLKQMHNKLSTELAYQKYALDQHSIVSITDVHGTITYVNEKFCTISQYSADELLGQNHRMINSGFHPKEFFRDMYCTVAAMKTWQGDVCNRAKDGSLYWVATTIVSNMHNDRKQLQYISIRTDITAHKVAQLAMQRNHNLLNAAERLGRLGSWEVDLVTGKTFWSDEIYRILELDPQRFAPSYENFLNVVHPDDRDKVSRVYMRSLDGCPSNCETCRSYYLEYRLRFVDERIKWVHGRWCSNCEVMGKPLKVVGAMQDVSTQKLIQLELLHNQDLLNEAQRLGRLGSWEHNLVSGKFLVSKEIYRILELDPQRFAPSYEDFMAVIHPDDRDKVDQNYKYSLEICQYCNIDYRLLLAGGRIKWVSSHWISKLDVYGKPLSSAGVTQDITEQKMKADALRVAAVTFETQDGILITDANLNIIRVNQAFQDITGYRAAEVLGKNPRILSSGRHDETFYTAMWQQLLDTGKWSGEMWDRRKNGQIYPKWLTITAVKDSNGKTTEYVGIFSDITNRKEAEEKILNLALYDTLTKLPNRRLLLDRISLALTASARSQIYGAVLFLDMDKFKTLNDTLGHDYGDLLLIDVAQRVLSCVREADTVARLGGDEFVVLIEDVDGQAEEASQKMMLIAEKIRASLASPYHLKEHEYHSSPSIGVTLFRGHEESVDTLLKRADMAMYQAKEAGRNAVRFFDPAMQQALKTRVMLEVDLRHAVSDGQLRLFYQIQVDNDQRPLGAEALVRWIHPKRGMVSPAQFIPVAEESSLILDIGHWVMETACRQLALWSKREQTRDLELSVNVSARQFKEHNFVENITTVLRAHHVNPARLKLELTENMVLTDIADVVAKMHALKALGIKLSMDDFGTGYSSLSYLKQLPLDQLKVDQSFVRDISSDPNDAMIVQAIINMAHNFHLDIIAEGVETEVQLAFLKHHGCLAYQGFLFSKPVPIEEFEALLGVFNLNMSFEKDETVLKSVHPRKIT